MVWINMQCCTAVFELFAVKRVREKVNIPVTCKIRVFDDVDKTIAYAKMIVDSGCYMLTVHGRTITQKGPLTGLANWSKIKAVRYLFFSISN